MLNILLFVAGNKDSYLTSDIIEGLLELEDENKVKLYAYVLPEFCIGNGIQHKHMVNDKFIESNIDKIDRILIFTQVPFFPKSHEDIKGSVFEKLEKWDRLGPDKHVPLKAEVSERPATLKNIWNKCAYIDESEYCWESKPVPIENKKLRPRFEPFNFTFMLKKCKWYFKRECYEEELKLGMIPLPFAYSLKRRYIPEIKESKQEKEIDIFCSFPQNWTGMRHESQLVCKLLQEKVPELKIDTTIGLWYEEYCRRMNKSYICIDAWGGGQINARPWEIIANGSVLFRQKYDVKIPNDFETRSDFKGQMIVEFENPQDLVDKLITYLSNKKELLEMSDRSFKHLMKYHTCRARVEYLLEKIQ